MGPSERVSVRKQKFISILSIETIHVTVSSYHTGSESFATGTLFIACFQFPLGGEFRSVFDQTRDSQKIFLSNRTISCHNVTSFREGLSRILIVSETFWVYFGLCVFVTDSAGVNDLPRQ